MSKRDRKKKAHLKARNIRRNNTPRIEKHWESRTRYVLETRTPCTPEGGWKREPEYVFRTKGDIARYMVFISSIIARNDQPIIEGRIIDLATGAVIKHIPAYEPTTLETVDA